MPTWERVDLIAEFTTRTFPDGYFPREMNAAERALSIENFEKAIYPIWMGIEKKDFEDEAKQSMEWVRTQNIMLEVLTMHRQDRAIHGSGHRPGRIEAPTEKKKQHAAASDKYAGWKGGE